MLYQVSEYEVIRKTDIGYILKKDNTEFFLHAKETNQELKIGSKVKAFSYLDKYKRVALSTLNLEAFKTRNGLTYGKFKVTSITPYGLFLNINTAKDILLSTKYLAQQKRFLPNIGDELLIVIEYNEKPKARFFKLDELNNRICNQGESITATVYLIRDKNIILVDDDLNKYLIDRKYLLNKKIRVGLKMQIKVLKNGENYPLCTIDEAKEETLNHEKEHVYTLLKKNFQGKYNYNKLTSPEVILKDFKMSKKAFKRAIGILYKERKIAILDDAIILL